MTTDYISKEKAELHLKLGRRLAIFIKVDFYFESITFDWISIEKQNTQYKTTLIRSINEGDEIFNDVLTFDTLNQDEDGYDKSTNHFFIGNLADCFTWIESNYNVKELAFVTLDNLKLIYTDLAKQGAFDKH
jgi:hypothetical protein